MYMVIVWDYFGVIADDAFWYTAQEIAATHGFSDELSRASVAVNKGTLSWEDFCQEVSEDTGIAYVEVIRLYNQHNINKHAVLTIKSLKKQYRHVLLSNASHTHLLPLLEKLGLNVLFDDIFVSSLIGYAKPDPRSFLHVLHSCDIDADQAILIDDMVRNCEAALSVGMNAITYSENTDIHKELQKFTAH